jgi:hypothetical protein
MLDFYLYFYYYINNKFKFYFSKLYSNFFDKYFTQTFSFSNFINFFTNTKKTFFNSIKSFFLFKILPEDKLFHKAFNNLSEFRIGINYLQNKKFSTSSRVISPTSFCMIYPKFPFLKYSYIKQLYIFKCYFYLNIGGKSLFKNLKYLNMFFIKGSHTVNMFLRNFFSINLFKLKLFLENNYILIICNSSVLLKHDDYIKIGDSFKISFSNKLIYSHLCKYFTKINNNLYKKYNKPIVDSNLSIVRDNYYIKRRVFDKSFTHKNIEISYMS